MTNHRILISPLRYPGSKRGLVDYIKAAIKLNALTPKLYVEPFVGGGSVAINLLQEELVERVILVDLDPWITSFWETVFSDTKWLIRKIQTMEVSLENWRKFKRYRPRTVRNQALTCFFLNRTSFSGILEERAGPIGGKEQASDYPIDCRFTATTRKTIIGRIEQIAEFRDRVDGIWNCSWKNAIQRIHKEQQEGHFPSTDVFYYFDPPFFEEADALYRYYFVDKDHEELRDCLLSLQDKWILSYDSAEQVENLYGEAIKKGTNGTKHHDIELLYSIARVTRKKGKEVILTNLPHLPPPISSSIDEDQKEKKSC